jgi:pimeloyl-ACP methyl ester carboxylesterase
MTGYLLLHGAASTGWMWHRVEALLKEAGHETAAPDLPAADPEADLHTYCDVAYAAGRALGDDPIVVVAQSMAGLYAPLLPARRPVARLVLLNAMIPKPGETGMEWWEATGHQAAQRAYLDSIGLEGCDPMAPAIVFAHDFTPELTAAAVGHLSDQESGPLETASPLQAWPDVPTHVIAAADDRFFPLEFMRRQAADRLGLPVDVIPGSHSAAITQPQALVDLLLAYEQV